MASIDISGKSKSSPNTDPTFTSSFQGRADAINNAYSGSQIKDNIWDKFSNWLGFRSSADKARLQLEQQRREALLQLKTTEAEQQYNSESAKAQRMREAGLNPDLQGLGEASEATEFNEPEGASDLSGLSTGSDVVSSVGNALQTAIGVYSSLQGLKLAGINISNEELRSADASSNHTLNLLRSLFSSDEYDDLMNKPSDPNSVKLFNISDKTFEDLGIYSKRARKQVRKRLDTIYDSYVGMMDKYDTFADFLKKQYGFNKERSAWYRINGNSDQSVFDSLRTIAEFERDILYAQSKYQADYFGYVNGEKKARAENAEYGFKTDYFSALKGDKRAQYENASSDFAKYVQDSKKQLFKRLTGKDASTFSLVLALQLMGETDFVSNSGIGDVAGLATKFL